MSPQIDVFKDYTSVPCLNVPAFVNWLVLYLGALPRGEWNKEKMLVKIPSFGICKIFDAKMHTLPPEFHLPIRVRSIRQTELFMVNALGIKGQGEEHWRIFSITDDEGKVIGHIHAAQRDEPLG